MGRWLSLDVINIFRTNLILQHSHIYKVLYVTYFTICFLFFACKKLCCDDLGEKILKKCNSFSLFAHLISFGTVPRFQGKLVSTLVQVNLSVQGYRET